MRQTRCWMVGYELENIENHFTLLFSGRYAPGMVDIDCDEIFAECQRVKRTFQREALKSKKELVLKRYFSIHQGALIDLLDSFEDHHFPDLEGKAVARLKESIFGLFTFIRHSLPKYFNNDIRLPKCLMDRYHQDQKVIIDRILDKFSANGETKGLIDLIVADMKEISENMHASFRNWDYSRVLESQLMAIDLVNHADLLIQDISSVLMQVNFNSRRFFLFYTAHINQALLRCETTSDKIEQLAYFLKISSQQHWLPQLSFDHESPAIAVQLIDWLSNEIHYLKTKRQLHIGQSSKDDGLSGDFKLNFGISVPQIACLIRAFIETGIIQNKNTSELARFVSKFVKTKKSEEVSYDSFRIKFYNVESGTKDAVKKVLQSMLQYMNRN